MPNHDLDSGDRAMLVLLMTIGGSVANADLGKVYGVELKKDRREKLAGMKLIEVPSNGKSTSNGKSMSRGGPMSLVLTSAGQDEVRKMLTTPPPSGGGLQVMAMNSLLAHVRRYLDENGGTPDEFLPSFDLDDDAIEKRIRTAYHRLAHRPGEWVTLANLRARLGGIPRHRVDEILIKMNRTPLVTIVPDSNQKTLTPADRDAAVVIGNQPKHAIAIGHR